MEIYCIKGNAYNHDYIEKIQSIVVTEKKLCYEGQGKRIKKSEIRIATEGTVYGAYKMYVLNLEEVSEARMMVKNKVLRYREIQLSRLKKEIKDTLNQIELTEKHNTKGEFEVTEYIQNEHF